MEMGQRWERRLPHCEFRDICRSRTIYLRAPLYLPRGSRICSEEDEQASLTSISLLYEEGRALPVLSSKALFYRHFNSAIQPHIHPPPFKLVELPDSLVISPRTFFMMFFHMVYSSFSEFLLLAN